MTVRHSDDEYFRGEYPVYDEERELMEEVPPAIEPINRPTFRSIRDVSHRLLKLAFKIEGRS